MNDIQSVRFLLFIVTCAFIGWAFGVWGNMTTQTATIKDMAIALKYPQGVYLRNTYPIYLSYTNVGDEVIQRADVFDCPYISTFSDSTTGKDVTSPNAAHYGCTTEFKAAQPLKPGETYKGTVLVIVSGLRGKYYLSAEQVNSLVHSIEPRPLETSTQDFAESKPPTIFNRIEFSVN
ncbi:hypothetical protein GCM10017783_06550 [Deinococcus piscis]|uniref:DUF11 domain-containing protein n=1 Tax=Deinococcus piscis TaxID=394230 RepID=A0ABQ3JZG8_9DEIO|nr:hypothetical protein [Deinococcus piscis]GHF97387.1 hypothetical protein GCM10017783_06550 [Deinococcus piscis]